MKCAYDLKFGEVGDDKEDSSVIKQWELVVNVGKADDVFSCDCGEKKIVHTGL